MTAERITPEAVEAAAVSYDAEDRAIAGVQVVMDFVQVGVIVSLLSPREWEDVAAYLYALIERAPLSNGKPYVAHRTVLGALAGELRGYARSAGQDVGLFEDLRGATSKAEERRIRQRIADQNAAFDRHIDDTIASHHAQHDLDLASETTTDAAHEVEEEPAATEQPSETTDGDWLL